VNAAHGHSQNSPPTRGIWHSLNRLLVTLIALTVLAVVAYRSLPEITKRRDQQLRVEQLKAEVERERQMLLRNTRIEELLKHDPEYVALIARDRLDLMKENETIYRVENAKPDKARMRLTK
jgi:cell division protein FtsB